MNRQLGSVFHEGLIRSKNKRKRNGYGGDEIYKDQILPRPLFFAVMMIIGLGILITRLFTLTIIEGARYRKLSQENRTREEKIQAPRGVVYDRNGKPLVRNIPVFYSNEGDIIFERKQDNESSDLTEGVTREYIYGPLFAHAVGFIGEISEKELESPKVYSSLLTGQSLELGDMIGKMGVEQYYDNLLRGIAGKNLFEVDALGNKVRVLGRKDPVIGASLTLSLDLSIQQKVSQAMSDNIGAVVVSNPQNGEILALYSSPSFDPNSFIRDKGIDEILEREDRPMFNRVIAGLYPPGSTFKIVTSIAALESGAIDKNTKYEDVGILKVGDYSYGNWYFTQYGKKDGMVDIVKALQRSNDIFFYHAGEDTGIASLHKYANILGTERQLGIDIQGEAVGLMPDPEWRLKEKGERWYLGNTYHVSIGQGDVLTTPLQVNYWTNIIANDGKACTPHLLKSQVRSRNTPEAGGVSCQDLNISDTTINLIKDGMEKACSSAEKSGNGLAGTGWPFFNFSIENERIKIDNKNYFDQKESTLSAKRSVRIPVACKTGTAEFADAKKRTHAWFTVFAPVKNPKISITVLVEAGGEGSSVAAPIAKEILNTYFQSL